MKKLFILLVFTLAVFLSCSNDEDVNQDPIQSKLIKVTELITQNGELTEFGPESNISYQYGTNNFVSVLIASGGYTREFTYNSNNQIINELYSNNNGFISNTNYTYENGMISVETYDDGSSVEYIYQNNQIVQMIFNYPNNPENNGSISLTYDTNGNVLNIVNDSTSETIESYQYDDKINPFSLLFPTSYNKVKRISNNNMTYREDCQRVITYEYNALNLPTNSVYNDCGNYTKERTYFYE